MKNYILIISVLMGAFLLSSCGAGSKQIGPAEVEVKEAIYDHFAQYNGGDVSKETFHIANFQVVSVENIGNSVDENIVGRYSGTLALTKPLYVRVETLDDETVVIKAIQDKGLKTPFSGRYESTVGSLTGNSKNWNTSFNIDKITENGWKGKPIHTFINAVIIDTPEYNAKIEELAEIERERQAKEISNQKRFISNVSGEWISTSGVINLYGRGRYAYERNALRLNKKPDSDNLPVCQKPNSRIFEMTIPAKEGKNTTVGKTGLLNQPKTNIEINYETVLNARNRSLSVNIQSHDSLPCIKNRKHGGSGHVYYPKSKKKELFICGYYL